MQNPGSARRRGGGSSRVQVFTSRKWDVSQDGWASLSTVASRRQSSDSQAGLAGITVQVSRESNSLPCQLLSETTPSGCPSCSMVLVGGLTFRARAESHQLVSTSHVWQQTYPGKKSLILRPEARESSLLPASIIAPAFDWQNHQGSQNHNPRLMQVLTSKTQRVRELLCSVQRQELRPNNCSPNPLVTASQHFEQNRTCLRPE